MLKTSHGENERRFRMGLFESKEFNERAMTELERRMREIEAKVKSDKLDDTVFANLSANIDFSQTARLIKQVQADDLRKRLEVVKEQREKRRLEREVYGNLDDGFENPHERGLRFANMDEVRERIENEKATTGKSGIETKTVVSQVQSTEASAERTH